LFNYDSLQNFYLPYIPTRVTARKLAKSFQLADNAFGAKLAADLEKDPKDRHELLAAYKAAVALYRSIGASQQGSMDMAVVDNSMETDLHKLAFDYTFERMGCPTWYISPDLIWFLENSSSDLRASEFYIPKNIIRICFPRPYEHAGVPCREIMMCQFKDTAMTVAEEMYLFKDREEVLKGGKASFRIFSSTGDIVEGNERPRYDWNNTVTDSLLMRMPPDDEPLEDSIQKCVEGVYISSLANAAYNSGEWEMVGHALRMAMMCIIYANATEGVLTSHRESKQGNKVKPPRGGKFVVRLKVIPRSLEEAQQQRGLQGERHSPMPHVRRFHFRTLRHERYVRAPNGMPKTIRVKESFIGGSVHDAELALDESYVKGKST